MALPRITQARLSALHDKQDIELSAQYARIEDALEIKRLLNLGAEIEGGQYFFDRRRLIAHDGQKNGKAVGE